MTGQGQADNVPYGEEVLDELYPMLTEFLEHCSDQARSTVIEKLHRFLDKQTAGRPRNNHSGSHLLLAVHTKDEAKPSSTTPETKPEVQARTSISDMSGDPGSEDFDVAEAITRGRDLASQHLQESASETASEGSQKSDEKIDADHHGSPQHADKPKKYNCHQMASHLEALYSVVKQQVPQTTLVHDGLDKGVTDSEPISLDATCKSCSEVKQAGTDQSKNQNWRKFCKACRDSANRKPEKGT